MWIDESVDFTKIFDNDLHRVSAICERCRHFERFQKHILCRAMPSSMECVYLLPGETPFGNRAVPKGCPFYAEQFLMQHQNDEAGIS